jgi:hypothetical protein
MFLRSPPFNLNKMLSTSSITNLERQLLPCLQPP